MLAKNLHAVRGLEIDDICKTLRSRDRRAIGMCGSNEVLVLCRFPIVIRDTSHKDFGIFNVTRDRHSSVHLESLPCRLRQQAAIQSLSNSDLTRYRNLFR